MVTIAEMKFVETLAFNYQNLSYMIASDKTLANALHVSPSSVRYFYLIDGSGLGMTKLGSRYVIDLNRIRDIEYGTLHDMKFDKRIHKNN